MLTATTAPVTIGRVALTVHDLDRVSDFYQRVVGLHLLTSDAGEVLLGDGETVLLELRRDAEARRRNPREAGLFHTAFLLPTREDLGRWTRHAAAARAPVVGTADHSVSEAIYLTDPEGNGVEIYADRPRSAWRWKGGQVEMPSDPLDIEDLLASAGTRPWAGFPAGSAIGHVHLQVGAIAPAEAFYAGVLGLDITCRYPGGTFYGSGGYHHRLATNIWNSRGATVRSAPSTGLANVEIEADAATLEAVSARMALAGLSDRPGLLSLRDPWGTPITIRAH
ncbi:Catechol-2,3-dioxygenase [compost metagenome]|jgi:catechol 2,3-dioxygenase